MKPLFITIFTIAILSFFCGCGNSEQEEDSWLTRKDYPAPADDAEKKVERDTIYLLPIGEVGEKDMAIMKESVEVYFSKKCVIMKKAALPEKYYNAKRKQYYASGIIDSMKTIVPKDAITVMGVVDGGDLYTDSTNYVFGLASLQQRVAVHSLVRYRPEFFDGKPDRNLFVARMIKVLTHEIGHTFDISHCEDEHCGMSYANSLDELDLCSLFFCPDCLNKMNKALKLDLKERAKKQIAFFKKLGIAIDKEVYTPAKEGDSE